LYVWKAGLSEDVEQAYERLVILQSKNSGCNKYGRAHIQNTCTCTHAHAHMHTFKTHAHAHAHAHK